MTSMGERLQAKSREVWRWFFPEPIETPECLAQILELVFPTFDRSRASFHRGLPHLLKAIPNQAITLPATLSPRRGRVYVHPRYWDPCSVEGLGLIVHETFHLLQIQESGPGLGLVRPFTVLYFACAAGNRFRYDGHPMESDAYVLAGYRHSRFESTVDPAHLPLEHLSKEPPSRERLDLADLSCHCECLATPTSGLAFWQKLAASTPGAGRLLSRLLGLPLPAKLAALPLVVLASGLVVLWLALWSGAVAAVWAAQLLVEGAGALAAGLLWAGGAVVGAFERLARPARPADPGAAARP